MRPLDTRYISKTQMCLEKLHFQGSLTLSTIVQESWKRGVWSFLFEELRSGNSLRCQSGLRRSWRRSWRAEGGRCSIGGRVSWWKRSLLKTAHLNLSPRYPWNFLPAHFKDLFSFQTRSVFLNDRSLYAILKCFDVLYIWILVLIQITSSLCVFG